MSLPLSSASDLQARKELARLRMEMHRQQLRFHAQPLCHPLDQVKGMFTRRRHGHSHSGNSKLPLLVSTAVLAVFGKRLGKLGTLARLGLTLYPLLKAGKQLRP